MMRRYNRLLTAYFVVSDGRLVWLQDAYTTSDALPYSQQVPRTGINYITVLVGAYGLGEVFTRFGRTLKIDTGDTAWMIVATALVMLMSIPGLALFYGGLAKRKDSLNTMAMTFVAFCIVSLLWVIYGYTFSFGTDIRGIIGGAGNCS